jgi:hypothetical protein
MIETSSVFGLEADAADDEHDPRLEALGAVHGHDLHRVLIGLLALQIAVVGAVAAVGDPGAQPRDQLGQLAATALDLGVQVLEDVAEVGDRAGAAAGGQGSLDHPGVVEDRAEQPRVVEASRQAAPVVEVGDQRVIVGRVLGSGQTSGVTSKKQVIHARI